MHLALLGVLAANAAFAASVAACGSTSCQAGDAACPTDAPTATLYGSGSYSWAEHMVPWECVFNVLDYGPASDADAAFAKAQAAAVASGGGVVYFPAGHYAFKDLLRIDSNIVIRGDVTTAPAKSGKKPGTLAPKTVFSCPDRQHLGILNVDANATNMGVVNIGLVGCSVMLWPALQPAIPVAFPGFLKSYWYGATGVAGTGSNKLVLSCTSTQVAYGHADPTSPSSNPTAWRFGLSISVYGDNVLVGNNLVPPSPKGPTVTLSLSGKSYSLPFPYDNRYGVDVNRLLYGGALGKTCTGGPGTANPACAPYFFPANNTVRDNWVYNCGRVSFVVASGCNGGSSAATPAVGDGMQLVNNHAEHCAGATCYTVDGVHVAGGSDTNENRGYDVGGYCLNATSNSGHIYRMKTPNGYPTVDGEGILFQASANSAAKAHVWSGNDLTYGSSDALASGYMAFYKLFDVDDVVLEDNVVDSHQYIGIVCDSSHDKFESVKCSNNKPAATLCGKSC